MMFLIIKFVVFFLLYSMSAISVINSMKFCWVDRVLLVSGDNKE